MNFFRRRKEQGSLGKRYSTTPAEAMSLRYAVVRDQTVPDGIDHSLWHRKGETAPCPMRFMRMEDDLPLLLGGGRLLCLDPRLEFGQSFDSLQEVISLSLGFINRGFCFRKKPSQCRCGDRVKFDCVMSFQSRIPFAPPYFRVIPVQRQKDFACQKRRFGTIEHDFLLCRVLRHDARLDDLCFGDLGFDGLCLDRRHRRWFDRRSSFCFFDGLLRGRGCHQGRR